jgi:hypothetical protein
MQHPIAVKTRRDVSEPKSDGGKRLRTSDYPREFREKSIIF